jgi:hypothetical protein
MHEYAICPTWGLGDKQTLESGVLHLVSEHNVSMYVRPTTRLYTKRRF